MQIYLIRHGRTLANEQKLYCGRVDVPLSERGVLELTTLKNQGIYPSSADMFFTSGLLRAEQTLEILYGKVGRVCIPDVAEYDFGLFEMKSHDELQERADYQVWACDETGEIECPDGESKNRFNQRVIQGYLSIVSEIQQSGAVSAVIVCHGGAIACIMEYFQPNTKSFYEWHPQSGHGYRLIYVKGRFHKYEKL